MIDAQSSVELWLRYRLPEHRERAIADHHYLCRRAARRFLRPGLERADLEQIAAIGVIKAVDRYDAAQTTPFEAYAWLLALGELMHYVRDSERLMRAPRRIQELERRWSAAERELGVLLGRGASDRDVARHVNATPAQEREIREYRAARHVASFDSAAAYDRRFGVNPIDAIDDRLAVESVLAALTPLERRIVRSIHIDGLTVAELAHRLGYSRRHLTRLHGKAMARLRNHA